MTTRTGERTNPQNAGPEVGLPEVHIQSAEDRVELRVEPGDSFLGTPHPGLVNRTSVIPSGGNPPKRVFACGGTGGLIHSVATGSWDLRL